MKQMTDLPATPAASAPPVSAEQREMVMMLCRAMLMFIQWANKRYALGFRLNS